MRNLAPLLCFFEFFSVAFLPSPYPQSATSQPPDRVFSDRLRAIAGEKATDCGTTSSSKPDDAVAACGLKAFQDNNAFFLGYYDEILDFTYGLAGDSDSNIFAVNYESRRFPSVAPNRHTQLMDDDHSRITECTKPVKLDRTNRGLLACITPVNREESEKVTHQTPLETTVCAIVENPAAFNNRLVRPKSPPVPVWDSRR